MEVFLGIPAADGVGVGTAFVIPEAVKRAIPQKRIRKEDTAEGWERFQSSIQTVTAQISRQLENLPPNIKANDTQREIFETYVLMLGDPVFLAELKDEYEKTLNTIEYTIDTKAEEYASRLRNAGNEYLAERAQDITDVFGRVLDDMMDIHPFDINRVPDGAVIVATTLSPTDTIILSKRKISGLALTEGGVASHVVILARNYGIPTVVGLTNITKLIHTGDKVIVDGKTAEILSDPDSDTLVEYEEKIAAAKRHEEALKAYLDKPAQTKDGTLFELYANIGTPEEADRAKAEGADGIGLFRTEFLYMSTAGDTSSSAARSFDEDTQFEAYKRVLETMEGKPVTIRTLDAGGDKLINSVDIPAIAEKNPLMGLRAVRLSLAYPQILKTQLRALYRASVYGDLRIMLPLITSVEQVAQCKAVAQSVCEELAAENMPFHKDVPIGIMVETAAAAVTSDCLAKESAFFSLGTNDLTQYTLGVDRENSTVSDLYDEFNLAVLRLIAATLDSAKKVGIPCSVCGEMAGRSDSVLVLAGMGVRSLSMSPKLILGVKELLSRFTIDELQSISAKHLNNL
ncbi:MAG TPA: phosphoenolpyruvate--protein phosphotransferase [Treponema sp.]|mgnify:CR=1 FL=1|nr:phosphoenolpyruvate--protein phosphotransferase [Treponema sp.]